MGELKPYPEYKDSGVDWIGQIPKHWQVMPGRACFYEKNESNIGLKEKTVLSLSYGKIVVKPEEKLHGLVPASFETYQVIDPGDIVIRPTDLQNDWNSLRFGLAENRGIITSAYLCFQTTDKMNSKYGHLLLHTYDLNKVFYGLGSGLRQNLDWTDFKYLPCLVPSLPEQEAIIRFHRWINKQLLNLINTKHRFIKLLDEQKQVIISSAVTRGLDPNIRLKPSGIEWIGDIPEYWGIQRLRNISTLLVSNVDKHSKKGEIPIRLCNYTDVYKNEFIHSEMSFKHATATLNEIEKYRIRKDDVIITKDSEEWLDIGVPAYVTSSASDLICGYHLAIIRPDSSKIMGRFLHWQLMSYASRIQFSIRANGVTRYGLSHGAIKEISLLVPPLSEQSLIVRFIDNSITDLNHIISDTKREIALLHEYRTRMVSDIITGKVDVSKLKIEEIFTNNIENNNSPN